MKGKVLVTGANGFVGRQVLPLLKAAGWEVHALSRGDASAKGIRFHRGNILEPGAAEFLMEAVRPSHLMHLAWVTTHNEYWESPENEDWLSASQQLISSFYAFGGQKAVLVGSCAEYDWSAPGPYREDSSPLRPASRYGQAKLRLLEALQEGEKKHGWSFAWARLFFLFGPFEGQLRFIPQCIRAALNGESLKAGSPDFVRDYLYTKDAAAGLVSLLESRAQGAYNLASGISLRIGSLCQEIEAAVGQPLKVEFDKNLVVAATSNCLVADTAKIRRDLTWRPAHSLAEALKETVEWWKLNETRH